MKIQALKSVAPHCFEEDFGHTKIRTETHDQAVMSLKAPSNKVDEHTVRREAPTWSSRKGGYHVQSHDDVKSSEEEGVLTRLPGGAARPSHDDVKSSAGREQGQR